MFAGDLPGSVVDSPSYCLQLKNTAPEVLFKLAQSASHFRRRAEDPQLQSVAKLNFLKLLFAKRLGANARQGCRETLERSCRHRLSKPASLFGNQISTDVFIAKNALGGNCVRQGISDSRPASVGSRAHSPGSHPSPPKGLVSQADTQLVEFLPTCMLPNDTAIGLPLTVPLGGGGVVLVEPL